MTLPRTSGIVRSRLAPADAGESGAGGSLRDAGGGFTLIETMMALLIVALVASLALPWTQPGRSTASLGIEAQRLASLLRADRNAALRTNRPVVASVNVPGRIVASGVAEARITLPESVSFRVTSVTPSAVAFYPDGRSSGAEFLLSRGAAAIAVRVNPYTAAIDVEPR